MKTTGGDMLAEDEFPDYWRFSLAVYGYPEMAQTCLTLQDRVQLDINVLLIALFAAGNLGRSITLEEISAGDRQISAWRKEVVEPLRKIRIQLKEGPSPAPCSDTDSLRSLIKSAELNAEFIEQGVLAKWVQSLPRRTKPENDIYILTATRVLDYYASKINYAADRTDLRRRSQAVAKVAALPVAALRTGRTNKSE